MLELVTRRNSSPYANIKSSNAQTRDPVSFSLSFNQRDVDWQMTNFTHRLSPLRKTKMTSFSHGDFTCTFSGWKGDGFRNVSRRNFFLWLKSKVIIGIASWEIKKHSNDFNIFLLLFTEGSLSICLCPTQFWLGHKPGRFHDLKIKTSKPANKSRLIETDHDIDGRRVVGLRVRRRKVMGRGLGPGGHGPGRLGPSWPRLTTVLRSRHPQTLPLAGDIPMKLLYIHIAGGKIAERFAKRDLVSVRMSVKSPTSCTWWEKLGLLCANLGRQDARGGDSLVEEGTWVQEKGHPGTTICLSCQGKDAQS